MSLRNPICEPRIDKLLENNKIVANATVANATITIPSDTIQWPPGDISPRGASESYPSLSFLRILHS